MYFLHYTLDPDLRINVAPFLLNHIPSLLSRSTSTSPFCIGGLVTAIANYLNLKNKLVQLPFWQAEFLDIEYFQFGHLVKARRDGRYNLMVQHKVIPSIILQNPDVTRIDIAANWIYDLQAPAPGEKIQENQAGVENAVPEINQQGTQQEQAGNDPQPTTIKAIYASILLQD